MVIIEFGSLKELADTAHTYHANMNKLYSNFDEFTLAVDKVVRNIIVFMYAHYTDWWPINSTCVGHRALLMQSMLEFAFIYGRYCHCKQQLKRFNPAADDPCLSVDALMKDARGRRSSAGVRHSSITWRSGRLKSKKCSHTATTTSLNALMRSGVPFGPWTKW